LDTDNKNLSGYKSNFYNHESIYFATKHGKADIIKQLLNTHSLACHEVIVDTDQLGTFSGEVERQGDVKETLRLKIALGMKNVPNGRLFLASEGSFGPHPAYMGLVTANIECLLFYDRQLDIEILGEHLCMSPVTGKKAIGPHDDFQTILSEFKFPSHGVIVHPEDSYQPIFKGLHDEKLVVEAMLEAFTVSRTGKAFIATDLRANHNPTRRESIYKAAEDLLVKLASRCPSCNLPGFAVSRGVPGLPCEECGIASEAAEAVESTCVKCDYTERKPRPDGKKFIQAFECHYCNP
jgi:hypothetical protein